MLPKIVRVVDCVSTQVTALVLTTPTLPLSSVENSESNPSLLSRVGALSMLLLRDSRDGARNDLF
jgi:hypothetical protein